MYKDDFFKNELMESLDPHFHKAMPTEEDCKRIKAHEAYYRQRLDKIMGEHMLVLFKIVCGEKNETIKNKFRLSR